MNFMKRFKNKTKIFIKMQSRKILLFDTSFLLLIGLNGVDIFSLIEDSKQKLLEEISGLTPAITNTVLKELTSLSNGNSRKAKAAKLALKLIKQKNLKIIKTPIKNVDEGLVVVKPVAIATMDKELARQALKNKIKIVTLHNNRIIIRV